MMKRILAMVLMLVLFLQFIPGALASDPPIAYGAVDNPNPQDRLNLRETPSINAKSFGRYYNGTLVYIMQYATDGWAKVLIGGENGDLQGYMQTKYLQIAERTEDIYVADVRPLYFHQGTFTLYDDTKLKNVRDSFSNVNVIIMGFTDTYWHVMLENGATGFAKPTDKSILDYLRTITAVVNNPDPKERLHLRLTASTNGETFGKFYNGMMVNVLDTDISGKTWLKVSLGGSNGDFYATGYMMKQYLAFDSAAGKVKNACPETTLYNKSGNNINIRKFYLKPTNDVLATYPSGTKVKVLGIHADYIFVEVDGLRGIVGPKEIK